MLGERQSKSTSVQKKGKKRKRGRAEGVPRTRVYQVNMMQAGASAPTKILSKIELETREKMLIMPSPYEELDKKEESQRIERLRAQLKQLAGNANFTEAQQKCFHYLCVEQMSLREAARKIGIDVASLFETMKFMELKLKKASKANDIRRKARKMLNSPDFPLTRFEQHLLILRFIKRMSCHEIAGRLAVNEKTIRRNLRKFGLFQKNF